MAQKPTYDEMIDAWLASPEGQAVLCEVRAKIYGTEKQEEHAPVLALRQIKELLVAAE